MLFFCSAFFKPWHIKIVFCLNTILLPSLRDKLPFYKPLPTTMNHQQCRQGTPTEVVVLVLCLSIKVMCMFMLNVCVRGCALLMFAPFFTARCQYQTQRWEEIANGTWGGETDQFEVEKEMRMSLYLCTDTVWISVFYFNVIEINGFPQCPIYLISIHPHS